MAYIDEFPNTPKVKIVKQSILKSWDNIVHQEHKEMFLNQLIKASVDDYIDSRIENLTPKV